MAQDRTAFYDMLVQISEAEINDQLETAFLAGGVIPPSMSVPVNAGPVTGTANLNFAVPTADLDRPRPRLGLTIPFENSELAITAPLPATLSPLAGTITVVDAIQVISVGSDQIVTVDFNDGAPDVTVAFDAASQAILAPALAAAGLTQAQADAMVAGIVLQQLQTGVQRIDLSPPIPVIDDTDPTTIFDIDVTTVNDTLAADRDCIAFGIRMANDSGGNINQVTSNFIPAGSRSMVMMSNFWLLARIMRPRIATSLGRPVTDFDTPMRLNRNIPAPGGTGTLTRLEARVEGNRIRVDGRATASGTGWSAESNFFFFVDIGLAGGALTVTATTPVVDTDVDLAWWVWLASLGLGGLFGGIIGVIVAAIVLAIVEAVAGGVVDGIVGGGIGGSLGSIPSVPLGPIGGGLTLTSVLLDDLELRCSILRSLDVPVKHSGQHTSLAGFAADIDIGQIGGSANNDSDLVWIPGNGLVTHGPARLTLTGAPFGALTPVQVSRMPLTGTAIPQSQIPISLFPNLPFFPHDEVVFGARTSDGRYAKVRAWRSLPDGGALKMEWVTWNTPVPHLKLTERCSIIDRGEVEHYVNDQCQQCTRMEVARCCTIEAHPRLMAYPVDYRWCLCGEIIDEGVGTVTTPGGTVDYKLEGRWLIVRTDLGEDFNCEVCVSAIDANGIEQFECRKLVMKGVETSCRPCRPALDLIDIVYLPPIKTATSWRPVMMAMVDKDNVD